MTIGKDRCVRRNLCVLMALVVAMCGCTPVRYRESADKETYRIIREKQEAVFGEADTVFTIEKQPLPTFLSGGEAGPGGESALAEKPVSIEGLSPEELGELELSDEKIADLIIPTPPNAVNLTLAQALELAVANSRQFQDQKERVFLTALGLTLQRHLWRPQLGLTGSATGRREGDEKSIGAESKFSLGQALASGAQFALDLGTNFAEFLTGDKRRAVGSLLSFSFTQPLLRGGGRLVARENLTQAERDVVYDVRDFARYRKQFSVQVASGYYGVLQTRDSLINSFRDYISRRRDTLRLEEMFRQKHIATTLINVDQARQAELSANNAWIFARQDYFDTLDQFKISPLGLATETPIVLGNSQDILGDSERAAAIARDALRAGLDISISGNADTEPPTKAVKFQFNEGSYSTSILADLPIDRKQERNTYRRALIALESQKRSLSLLRDNIKLDVRQAFRRMEKARRSCEIQRISVDLATRRVDNEALSYEKGLAGTEYRDLLDARRDFLRALDELTSALVDYEIQKLQLWLSTEALQVDDRGLWIEEERHQRGDENAEAAERSETEEEELAES
jgi:outer membrane protein TolC